MAYNPGITYDTQSGAQGIASFGQSLAQGMQQYQANKMMSNQAVAKFEAATKADPAILQFLEQEKAPSAVLSAYKGLKTGGALPVAKAAMLSQYVDTFNMQKQAAMERQANEMKVQQMQAAQRQDQMLQNIGSGVTSMYKPQIVNNPYIQQAAQLRMATGQAPSPESVLAAQTRMDVMAGKGPNSPKASPQEVTLPSGAKVAFSPGTGAFSVLPQTPDQIAAAESARTEAELLAKSSDKLLADVATAADSARASIRNINEITSLYEQGATSGIGQAGLTKARAVLARMGLGNDELANQQAFETKMNSLGLEYGRMVMQGGGAVSNYERELVRSALPNIGNDPKANLILFQIQKRAAERALELSDLREKLENDGLSTSQIAKAVRAERSKLEKADQSKFTYDPEGAPEAPEAPKAEPLKVNSITRIK